MATVLTSLAACHSADELSVGAVASLVRTPGTALGREWSGIYVLEMDPGHCECTEDSTQDQCILSSISPPARVLQEDGILVINLDQGQLSGAIDADGTFAVGHVQSVRLQGLTSDLVVRLDGQFFVTDATNRFEGEIQARIFVHTTETVTNCRDWGTVTARATSSR